MAAGLALGLALGGAGISYAASSGSSSSPSTTTPSNSQAKPHPFPRGFGGGLAGRGLGLLGGGQIVHGQVKVRTPNGYQVVSVQAGQVTAVSTTSITVVSSDGFSQQYSVASSTIVNAQRDGIGSVKTGHQVQIIATQSGSTWNAVRIADLTALQNGRAAFGFGFPGHDKSGSGTPGTTAPPAAA
jgi:hypothetical protein